MYDLQDDKHGKMLSNAVGFADSELGDKSAGTRVNKKDCTLTCRISRSSPGVTSKNCGMDDGFKEILTDLYDLYLSKQGI